MRGILLSSLLLVAACGSEERERMEAAMAEKAAAEEARAAEERERADNEVVLATWLNRTFPKIERCFEDAETVFDYSGRLERAVDEINNRWNPQVENMMRHRVYDGADEFSRIRDNEIQRLLEGQEGNSKYYLDKMHKTCTSQLAEATERASLAAENLGFGDIIGDCDEMTYRLHLSKEDSRALSGMAIEGGLKMTTCGYGADELAQKMGLSVQSADISEDENTIRESEYESAVSEIMESDTAIIEDGSTTDSTMSVAEMDASMAEMEADMAEMDAIMADSDAMMADTE